MMDNDDPSAINPASDDPAPRSNSGISTAPPPDTPEATKRDFASEWIQSAMQTSKQMHRNEDFRREVARGLF
jgi:hypothetical protein